MGIYSKTVMETIPQSCTECEFGRRYGFVGDVKCRILNTYFTGNVEPPYKKRPDECPLIELAVAPNDPLTLEELREMDGEPVWAEVFVVGLKSHWGIVHGNYISDGKLPNEKGKCLLLIGDTGGYDIAWRAYRRKPEEV